MSDHLSAELGNVVRGNGFISENLQRLLQIISHRGILTDGNLTAISKNIFGNAGLTNYVKYINEINKWLKEVDLTIKSVICELTGQKYWTLVCTILNDSDEEGEDEEEDEDGKVKRKRRGAQVTQEESGEASDDDAENDDIIPSRFSKAQMEFLKVICNAIILSPERAFCIPSNECINLVGSMKQRFTRVDADKFLKIMNAGQWLIFKDGYVYVGPRSIAELQPYFKGTYEQGLKYCSLCKQLVFHGLECSNCEIKNHYHCFANFAKVSRHTKCSGCKQDIEVDANTLSQYSASQDSS